MSSDARLIVFYLPQFHPIPENDEWWGKGFTEWTNTAKAKPLFPRHYQPRIPADLGFYDLRVAETREAQAALAREYGIEAFCYYHYWFAGRQLLERPFAEVLNSGQPDFPFCLCWANETWTGIWHGAPHKTLVEQTYPGEDDHVAHFFSLLPAFRDRRYVRVDNKPLFVIYRPWEIPDLPEFIALWRKLAKDAGFPGLHLIAHQGANLSWPINPMLFDAYVSPRVPRRDAWISRRRPLRRAVTQLSSKLGIPAIFQYAQAIEEMSKPLPDQPVLNYPCVIPNWDNTPRSGANGLVLQGSTPELFARHLHQALARVRLRSPEQKIVFIKSWNEWAEGNHLEPDRKFGKAYLEAIRQELDRRV